MKFRNEEHKTRYQQLLQRMSNDDEYHQMAAYLMALIPWVLEDDVFDFENDCIRHEGLYEPWQTGSSRAATRLMFNLWNDCYYDYAAENREGTSVHYAAAAIFAYREYAPYFYEAVRIRFGWV